MPAALRADPELIRRPRPARARVAHVHLRAAALAADVKADVTHAGILLAQGSGLKEHREDRGSGLKLMV